MCEIYKQTNTSVKFSRVWAMPDRWTFRIEPIRKLLCKYVGDGIGWIDPFAGENSPAEITNDLNPERPAKFHLHAKDFALQLEGVYKGVLFDPPYSRRQTKECYDGIGLEMSVEDSQSFPTNVKDILANKIKRGGIAICFGWNTCGFGKGFGFELIEVMLICHGGGHNDTIVTVERKIQTNLF